MTVSGALGAFTLNIPFAAVYAALNYDSKINDATSHEVKVLKTAAVNNYLVSVW